MARNKIHSVPSTSHNAEGLLRSAMPTLNIGAFEKETTSTAPKIVRYYTGELAQWDDFKTNVMEFYNTEPIQNAFDRCNHLGVYPDPSEEEKNEFYVIAELTQTGNENSLSGRFYHNALKPIVHCVRTIDKMDKNRTGMSQLSNPLPQKVTFGDSWIDPNRIDGQQPDTVLKLYLPDAPSHVRLVGELKFPKTVDIGNASTKDDKRYFKALLGQVVNYMLGYKLQHGFISTYNDTVFLKLDWCEDLVLGVHKKVPCVYFSDVIRHTDSVDDKGISLRMALLFLVSRTCTTPEGEWHLDRDYEGWTNEVIRETAGSSKDLKPPYSKRPKSYADYISATLEHLTMKESEEVDPLTAARRTGNNSPQNDVSYGRAGMPRTRTVLGLGQNDLGVQQSQPRSSSQPDDAVYSSRLRSSKRTDSKSDKQQGGGE